jgi:hypothetical protein
VLPEAAEPDTATGAALQGGRVKLELASKHLMPQSARPIRAAWCPTLPSGEPEYVALGSEDCSVYVYDVSGATSPVGRCRMLLSMPAVVCLMSSSLYQQLSTLHLTNFKLGRPMSLQR